MKAPLPSLATFRVYFAFDVPGTFEAQELWFVRKRSLVCMACSCRFSVLLTLVPRSSLDTIAGHEEDMGTSNEAWAACRSPGE